MTPPDDWLPVDRWPEPVVQGPLTRAEAYQRYCEIRAKMGCVFDVEAAEAHLWAVPYITVIEDAVAYPTPWHPTSEDDL